MKEFAFAIIMLEENYKCKQLNPYNKIEILGKCKIKIIPNFARGLVFSSMNLVCG